MSAPAHDIIVVGLGPGGSTAARLLAARGLRVLGLDRAVFPRSKPCGGCLSRRAEALLPAGFRPLIERPIYGAQFTFRGASPLHLRAEAPVAYMVSRERFDHFLLEEARRAGAEIQEGVRVLRAREDAEGVAVETAGGTFLGRLLIGADGVNGAVARSLKLAPKRLVAVCLEGEVTVRPEADVDPGDEVRIEFGSVPFGYGWVFPKTDHLSVGVGGWQDRIGHPRAHYQEFLEDQYLVDAITEEHQAGYRIPIFDGTGRLAGKRTMLVGDAAAMVDPFLGEGMYYAMRSATVAAEVAAQALAADPPDLRAYEDRVEREIYTEFWPARTMARFLYTFPTLGYEILRHNPDYIQSFFAMLRGEASYADVWRAIRRCAAVDILRYVGLLRTPARDAVAAYDAAARRYDAYVRPWKALVARGAEEYVAKWLAGHVPSGADVLDAATGTGDGVRMVLAHAKPGRVVGVDASRGMLKVARAGLKDPRVRFEPRDITKLCFPDRSFDVVLCLWGIEGLPDPKAAVAEFLRLIRDDGFVIYAFASLPDTATGQLYARLAGPLIRGMGDAHFLPAEERPFHDCGHSRLVTFANGLVTVAVLRKCCTVTDAALPCALPPSWDAIVAAPGGGEAGQAHREGKADPTGSPSLPVSEGGHGPARSGSTP